MKIELLPGKQDLEPKLRTERIWINRYMCRQGGGFSIFMKIDNEMTHVGKCDDLFLQDCSFDVDLALHQEFLATNEFKNHAWVSGLISDKPIGNWKYKRVTYHPMAAPSFFIEGTGAQMQTADYAYMQGSSLYALEKVDSPITKMMPTSRKGCGCKG